MGLMFGRKQCYAGLSTWCVNWRDCGRSEASGFGKGKAKIVWQCEERTSIANHCYPSYRLP